MRAWLAANPHVQVLWRPNEGRAVALTDHFSTLSLFVLHHGETLYLASDLRLLMAQEALKGGLLDRGRELLKGVDETAVKDPNVYFNIAALLLNQQKPEDALPYLSRAIALDASYVDGYFQRGMTYIGLGKMAEAKADLQKVIALAPGSAQAETAKKALEQLK